MTWILTRPAKSSRELRCSLRQQLFSGYQRTSVQHQVLARQSQVHRSPRSRVDGVGPATEKPSSHLPSILHHNQRKPRYTNGQPQPRGRTFPSMPGDYATQTPTTRSSICRSGLPSSSQLSPVHVWWFSHAPRLRAAIVASTNYTNDKLMLRILAVSFDGLRVEC